MSTLHTPKVHRYGGTLAWTGAAGGPTASYDAYSREYTFSVPGKPPIRGSADVPFRGAPELHNPEDLLVCALSACHMLSYLAECARAGIAVSAYTDDAVGTMTFADRRLRFTEVLLRPRVTLLTGDPAKALRLHERAHEACFIANSVNFPVRHEARVDGA